MKMTIERVKEKYAEFIDTRVYKDRKDFPDFFAPDEWDDIKGGYFYDDNSCYIMVGNDNAPTKYYMMIEKDEYFSDDLDHLENILYDEYYLTL